MQPFPVYTVIRGVRQCTPDEKPCGSCPPRFNLKPTVQGQWQNKMKTKICSICKKEKRADEIHGFTLSDGAFDLCEDCIREESYLRKKEGGLYQSSNEIRESISQ